jgi:hypothetical protein
MSKNKGTIILSIILAFQLIVPIFCLCYEKREQSKLEQNAQEVFKLSVDDVLYDDGVIYFNFTNDLEERKTNNETYSPYQYMMFEKNEQGNTIYKFTDTKPNTSSYANMKHLVNVFGSYWYDIEYKRPEITNLELNDDYFYLYEKNRLPETNTDAYITVLVYNGRIKISDIYIGEQPILEVLNDIKKNEEANTLLYD